MQSQLTGNAFSCKSEEASFYAATVLGVNLEAAHCGSGTATLVQHSNCLFKNTYLTLPTVDSIAHFICKWSVVECRPYCVQKYLFFVFLLLLLNAV
jgi:hypothetical protein